tara:strand:- start:1369 stop:2085 length:717 start_codon:yes stop_codon:yes gene_type:complete
MIKYQKPVSAILLLTMTLFLIPAQVTGQITQKLYGDGKTTIAILDLEGRGISTLEAQTLTDRMRSELVKTGAVTIVERSQMNEILGEQGFQQTGCTSTECAVEVGKLLGVSNMITGSIGKIGSSYTLDIRIFEVQSGAISKTVNTTYKGEVDGLIMEVEKLAWDIVGLTPPSGRFPGTEPVVAAVPVAAPVQKKPKKKRRTLLWLTLGALAAGGGAYAYYMLQEEETIGEPPAFPTVP